MLLCCRSTEQPRISKCRDIAGIYETYYPGTPEKKVYILFCREQKTIEHKNCILPLYRVSLWENRNGKVRKFRDSMFGTFTHAVFYSAPGNHQLVWISSETRKRPVNYVFAIDSEQNIYIADNCKKDSTPEILYILTRTKATVPLQCSSGSVPDITGIFSYNHSSTGKVTVSFTPSEETVSFRGEQLPSWSVRLVKEIPGFGYAPVREGLFGGSIKNDSFTLAALARKDEDLWLVLVNPKKPRRRLWNRIAVIYPDGGFGIGLNKGAGKFAVNSTFVRTAPAETRVQPASSFISLPGEYLVKPAGSGSAKKLTVSETPFDISGDSGKGTLYAASPADSSGFTHLRLTDKNGKCYIRWYNFGYQKTEELLVYDLDKQGNFKTGRETDSEPVFVARFIRIPDSGENSQE